MIRIITLAALVLTHIIPAQGQSRKFPYQAIITENETYIRSGPGSRYYPTARLSQGANVTVHRHDPGGWYMIAPPSGSFSWIRAEYVDCLAVIVSAFSEKSLSIHPKVSCICTRSLHREESIAGCRDNS